MKNKIAFFFLAIVGTGVLFLALGFAGMMYGGNYSDTYEALGTRGYEAWGLIGSSIGLIVGVIGARYLYHKLFCEKARNL